MAFEDDFYDMLADTVTVTPGILDGFGGFLPSGQEAYSLPCKIEGSLRRVRGSEGQELTSSVQVIVLGDQRLTTDLHRYTLPTRFRPNALLAAVAVEREGDEDGPVCEVVLLP